MTGAFTRDLLSGEIMYDNTKQETCIGGETQCYMQTANFAYTTTDGQPIQAESIRGGCFDESYRSKLDMPATALQRFRMGAVVSSLNFEICEGEPNCFDYSPEDSVETIMCKMG